MRLTATFPMISIRETNPLKFNFLAGGTSLLSTTLLTTSNPGCDSVLERMITSVETLIDVLYCSLWKIRCAKRKKVAVNSITAPYTFRLYTIGEHVMWLLASVYWIQAFAVLRPGYPILKVPCLETLPSTEHFLQGATYSMVSSSSNVQATPFIH